MLRMSSRLVFALVLTAGFAPVVRAQAAQGPPQHAGGARASVAAADTTPLTADERRSRFPRVYERRARGLGVILDREQIAAVAAPDVDELFRRVPAVRALIPGRNALEANATPCGRPLLFIDAVRTPPLAWEANRHRADLSDFIDLKEIELLEVHKSAELITEPFLRVEMQAAQEENESYGRPIGSAPPRRTIASPQSRRGTSCVRVVMLWTNQYREQ